MLSNVSASCDTLTRNLFDFVVIVKMIIRRLCSKVQERA